MAAVIESLGKSVIESLRSMDDACPTGLCDFVSVSPWAGSQRKDEAALVWGLAERLAPTWNVIQHELRYPGSGKRCDLVLEAADGGIIWIEVKHAWRTWFHDGIHRNAPFFYSGYFHGEHHSHSVASDFAKLEHLFSCDASFVALLLVGFDGRDAGMVEDMNALIERERLSERGWRFLSDGWETSQSEECWNRLWFAWRRPLD